jgi:FSR family fosmidomycin resistance protein-like MFS transporter
MKKILGLLSLAHFATDGAVLMLPALMPYMAKELGLSYSELGILGGTMLITGAAFQFVLGDLSDKIRKRNYLVASGLFLCFISLFLLGFSRSYLQILILAGLSGVGWSVYHPVGISILSGKHEDTSGKAFGIHGAAGGLGMLLFPLVAGIITEYYDWRLAFRSLSIIGISIGILFLWMTRELPETRTSKTAGKLNIFTPDVIVMIAVFSLYSMSVGGFTTFFPIKLNILGFPPSTIGFYLSLFFGTGIIGQYVGGVLMDKYSSKYVISGSLLTTSLMIYLLFNASQNYLLIFMLLTSFFSFISLPVAFAYIPSRTPVESRGAALGLFFSITGVIGATSPMIIGIVTDNFGMNTAFTFLPFVCLAGGLLMMHAK